MTLEGHKVSYVGEPTEGLAVGEKGSVLSSDGASCHVMWATGARRGLVDLLPVDDVVSARRTAVVHTLDDSLSIAPLQTVAVAETYEAEGAPGLLNALNEAGLLASFAQIAEDAVAHVSARLWEDDEFRQVLAHLDPEEGASLVSLASVVLLRDAFGGEPVE